MGSGQTNRGGLSRREALRGIAAGGLGVGAVGGLAGAGRDGEKRTRVLRCAHLTDVHLNGEKGSDEALARCYRDLQERGCELILNTGDTVMELNGASLASAESQWGHWHRVTRAESSVEAVHAIGNHDCWGWERDSSEPRRGKGMVEQELELPGRFYSVDRAGWRFVVLDSIWSGPGGGYAGRLDLEQFEWLAETLGKTGADTPVCVLTHIPIVTACGFFDGERFTDGRWSVPGSWMHEDAGLLKDLFARHKNVKLGLSGHMHQVDRIDFQGVSYLCSGAVSASWWNGTYYACDYGYTLLDLFDDGSFEHAYVGYGWGAPGEGGG